MSDTPDQRIPRTTRGSVSISKGAAWAGGGGLTLGTIALIAQLNGLYFTKEEGIATEKNVSRIEDLVKTTKVELVTQITNSNAENTRVLERKIDKVIEFMREVEERSAKVNDKQDRKIENLELIVLTKPRGR